MTDLGSKYPATVATSIGEEEAEPAFPAMKRVLSGPLEKHSAAAERIAVKDVIVKKTKIIGKVPSHLRTYVHSINSGF